jgi:hypothetical protein
MEEEETRNLAKLACLGRNVAISRYSGKVLM